MPAINTHPRLFAQDNSFPSVLKQNKKQTCALIVTLLAFLGQVHNSGITTSGNDDIIAYVSNVNIDIKI